MYCWCILAFENILVFQSLQLFWFHCSIALNSTMGCTSPISSSCISFTLGIPHLLKVGYLFVSMQFWPYPSMHPPFPTCVSPCPHQHARKSQWLITTCHYYESIMAVIMRRVQGKGNAKKLEMLDTRKTSRKHEETSSLSPFCFSHFSGL